MSEEQRELYQRAWKEASEINFQNGRFKNFQANLQVYTVDTINWTRCDDRQDMIREISKIKGQEHCKIELYFKNPTDDINIRENVYLAPIWECNYSLENHHWRICSIIKDQVFFTFPNKQQAYEMAHPDTKNILDKINFVKMNDHQLIDFLAKRLFKKSEAIIEGKKRKRRIIKYRKI